VEWFYCCPLAEVGVTLLPGNVFVLLSVIALSPCV
jgi:hypothetical protein